MLQFSLSRPSADAVGLTRFLLLSPFGERVDRQGEFCVA